MLGIMQLTLVQSPHHIVQSTLLGEYQGDLDSPKHRCFQVASLPWPLHWTLTFLGSNNLVVPEIKRRLVVCKTYPVTPVSSLCPPSICFALLYLLYCFTVIMDVDYLLVFNNNIYQNVCQWILVDIFCYNLYVITCMFSLMNLNNLILPLITKYIITPSCLDVVTTILLLKY